MVRELPPWWHLGRQCQSFVRLYCFLLAPVPEALQCAVGRKMLPGRACASDMLLHRYEEWVEPMVGDSTYNYVQSVLEVKGSILDRAVVERTRVTMGRRIGQGMFGVVLAGILAGEDGGESVAVAIKTLQRRDGETDKIMERNLAELADEAALAGSFLHPNVHHSFCGVVLDLLIFLLLQMCASVLLVPTL